MVSVWQIIFISDRNIVLVKGVIKLTGLHFSADFVKCNTANVKLLYMFKN